MKEREKRRKGKEKGREGEEGTRKKKGEKKEGEERKRTGKRERREREGGKREKGGEGKGKERGKEKEGEIELEGSLEQGSLDLETNSGAINLVLPAGTNATYDTSTTNGAIAVKPEGGPMSTTAGANRSLTGTFGTGSGATIRVRANSGAISIRVG